MCFIALSSKADTAIPIEIHGLWSPFLQTKELGKDQAYTLKGTVRVWLLSVRSCLCRKVAHVPTVRPDKRGEPDRREVGGRQGS